MKMFRVHGVILSFVLTFSLIDAFALPFEGLYSLDVIHYNDFHARFEETSVLTPTCRFNNNSCLGGFSRLYHKIRELQDKKPDALLLNAGDSFQGTYWYTFLKWNVTQYFMNMLDHTAHAIGNHEFDDGPENLAHYLAALNAPVLAANMDVSKEPSLQGLFQPSMVIVKKRRKIGIIGLITPETSMLSSPGNVMFTDPLEATEREALKLTSEGVDIIIVLSHCGLETDKIIAREYGQYVDIIVGGHSHSLLWNGKAPSGETVVGPYPVLVESAEDNHKVVIVQASAFTKYMGEFTVDFDYLGRFVKWRGEAIFLDRSIPEDPEINKKLQPYAKLVHDAENVPIGESRTTLNNEDCVFGECALGDMLVDSWVEFAQEKLGPTVKKPILSFIQRGDIKSSIMQGTITMGNIFELLPYNDKLQAFEFQGRHVLEALERSVMDAWAYDPFKGPWVLQVAGLQVTYNVSLPEGHRITSVYVGDNTTKDALDIDAYYQVVAPSYLANGGDKFTMFKNYKRNVQIIGHDQAPFIAYIKKYNPVNIHTTGRIVINS